MAKIIAILLVVLAIWAALEIYTGGSDGLMGRTISGFEAEPAPAADTYVTSAPQRARRSVERANQKAQERYKLLDRLLEGCYLPTVRHFGPFLNRVGDRLNTLFPHLLRRLLKLLLGLGHLYRGQIVVEAQSLHALDLALEADVPFGHIQRPG